MAVLVSPINLTVLGDFRFYLTDITGDSVYAAGGEALTPADLQFDNEILFLVSEPGQYSLEYDRANDKVKFLGPSNGIVQDDDNAATSGVAVYVHVDETVIEEQAALGHLEFVSPTNTDGDGTISSGGPGYTILDDDLAATGGVALFVAPAGAGFYANIGAATGIAYVPLKNGEFIKVTHDADPATNQTAVQVYFDEDGTNTYERLMAVVVDNADETFSCDTRGNARTEVPAGTDLSAVSVRALAYGR